MAATVQLGILAKLYLNTGTYGTPTWAAVSLVGDLTVNAKWDVVEVLTRASRMKLKVKTMLDAGVSGKMLNSLDDTSYTTIANALNADTTLDFLALTAGNTTNGARGYRFDAQVTNGTQDQGTGAAIFDDFELIPVPSANAPKSVLVASGAPVYTAI